MTLYTYTILKSVEKNIGKMQCRKTTEPKIADELFGPSYGTNNGSTTDEPRTLSFRAHKNV